MLEQNIAEIVFSWIKINWDIIEPVLGVLGVTGAGYLIIRLNITINKHETTIRDNKTVMDSYNDNSTTNIQHNYSGTKDDALNDVPSLRKQESHSDPKHHDTAIFMYERLVPFAAKLKAKKITDEEIFVDKFVRAGKFKGLSNFPIAVVLYLETFEPLTELVEKFHEKEKVWQFKNYLSDLKKCREDNKDVEEIINNLIGFVLDMVTNTNESN